MTVEVLKKSPSKSTGPELNIAQARRVALAAQGLHRGKPEQPASARALAKTFRALQLVQIDSVNVLTRSHYLPFFVRLGAYDQATLDRLSQNSPRKMVEYWAHEASFIRPEHFADLRLWQRRNWFGGALEEELERPLTGRILDALAAGRPMTARQLRQRLGEDDPVTKAHWGWNWHPVKQILEKLFIAGVVGIAGRNEQFERRYTLSERVLPGLSSSSTADPDGASRQEALCRLIDAAASAHGIGTVRCFADYFRLPLKASAEAVRRLQAEGRLLPISVPDWPSGAPVYLHESASVPRKSKARALLSPFDSLIFERRRLQSLFGMHYRIGIYTPAAQRTHGYYVLPFLLGDQLAARVDLKADRQAGVLRVQAAFAEPGAATDTAAELAEELRGMARWLSLDTVVVEQKGDLSAALGRQLAAQRG